MRGGRPASEAAIPEGRFAPVAQPEGRPRPHPVILLQGIVRSRFSLMRMARGLAAAGSRSITSAARARGCRSRSRSSASGANSSSWAGSSPG